MKKVIKFLLIGIAVFVTYYITFQTVNTVPGTLIGVVDIQNSKDSADLRAVLVSSPDDTLYLVETEEGTVVAKAKKNLVRSYPVDVMFTPAVLIAGAGSPVGSIKLLE